MSDRLRVPDGGRQFLLSYYGDDLTGSADVMEVLESAGIPTILYLRQPTAADAAAADPSIRAVGVAGTSRTMSVAEMDAQLSTVFEALAALGASMFHYKLCSTFDSSPSIGSIGHALEIARESFGTAPIPLVVGSPPLGRYTVFGDLYARAGDKVYRLDRHPTLPSHPVTPMREADLLRHLAAQTDLPAATMTTLDLDAPTDSLPPRYQERVDEAAAVVLFDVLTMEHLARIGSLLWPDSDAPVPLVAGSSGVETALVEHWRHLGWLDQSAIAPPAGERKTVLVLSGSCSEATRAQLDHAEQAGYGMLPLPPSAARDSAAFEQVARQAAELLANGRSVAVFTARGPADCEDAAISAALGEALAETAHGILERVRPGRVVVAGGDTSGRVARRLGIDSLRILTPIAPGSPLCRAQSVHERIDGLEISLKGGQVGDAAYFEQVRRGRA